MLRIVMLGRLGNNLFQYALGRVLAEKHGVPLIMDASWFNEQGWSQVNCIRQLPGPAAGKVKIVRRFSLASRALLKATGKHYWHYRGVPVLVENEHDQSFAPHFLDAPADCVLFGYFQTHRYFEGLEDTLRQELCTHHLGLEVGREDLAARLRAPGAVAVHIRRTDYSGNPNLDLCGLDYYQRSMQKMRDTLGASHFFIFSDDPTACRRDFTGDDLEIIPDAQATPLADLHLMSLASHHIIANSSYSWWAAWLGKKDGQCVIMPKQWFSEIHAPIEEKRLAHWTIDT